MDAATQQTMFSSATGNWATPPGFFAYLDEQFGPFTLDPCASADNAKCPFFYTKEDDGLAQPWYGTVFVNPPYGRGIQHWIQKAFKSAQKNQTRVVMLIPARTDTRYWHDYVMSADEIHFVKGRLKFGSSTNSAPFPSAVVVFGGSSTGSPSIFSMVAKQ